MLQHVIKLSSTYQDLCIIHGYLNWQPREDRFGDLSCRGLSQQFWQQVLANQHTIKAITMLLLLFLLFVAGYMKDQL